MATHGLWAAGVLLATIVLSDLAWSPAYMRKLRARIAAGDLSARLGMYRLTIGISWGAAALALTVMLAGGLSFAEIGFRLPDAGALERYGGLVAGAAVGLTCGAIAAVLAARRGTGPKPVGDIDVLLPRGGRERRWFIGVAVTAGVTEEVVYRALALSFLIAVLPGEARWAAVIVAAVLFGLAHAYQGVAGMVFTGLLAGLLGALYLGTGSLLPGIVLHSLIDLRALLLRPEPDPSMAATTNDG